MKFKILKEDMDINTILDIINNPKNHFDIYKKYSGLKDGKIDSYKPGDRIKGSDIIINVKDKDFNLDRKATKDDVGGDAKLAKELNRLSKSSKARRYWESEKNSLTVSDDAFTNLSEADKRKFIKEEFFNQYKNIRNLLPAEDVYIDSLIDDGFEPSLNPMIIFIDKLGNASDNIQVNSYIASFLREEFDKQEADPNFEWLYNPFLYENDSDKDIVWKINAIEYFEEHGDQTGKSINGEKPKTIKLSDLLDDSIISNADKMKKLIRDANIWVKKSTYNDIDTFGEFLFNHFKSDKKSPFNSIRIYDQLQDNRLGVTRYLLSILQSESGLPENNEKYLNYKKVLDNFLQDGSATAWDFFLDIDINDKDIKNANKNIWSLVQIVLDRYIELIKKNAENKANQENTQNQVNKNDSVRNKEQR